MREILYVQKIVFADIVVGPAWADKCDIQLVIGGPMSHSSG
jgi:hypothetical protein